MTPTLMPWNTRRAIGLAGLGWAARRAIGLTGLGWAARRAIGPAGLGGSLLMIALLGALLVLPAAAQEGARFYLFDRAAWSPDGRTVGVIGRYHNTGNGETWEDTLLVDVDSGRITCANPSMHDIVLSRDGRRILGRGRWGLFDREVASGRGRMILSRHPFRPSGIVEYSYDPEVQSVVVIDCPEDYPELSGVYSYPLDGGPKTRLLADGNCGPQSLNFWQTHRRDIRPTPDNVPRLKVPTVIPAFPGTVWTLQTGDTLGVAVWGNGTAPPETLCTGCMATFVSWPPEGGVALVSTAPEGARTVRALGDLWLLKPSRPPEHLGRGVFTQAAWPDSSFAFVLSWPGPMLVADVPSGTARPLDMSLVPQWLRTANLKSAFVWTVRLDGVIFDQPDSARIQALALRDLDVSGYSLDPAPGGPGHLLCVGALPDSAAAAALAGVLKAHKVMGGRVTGCTPLRRPVSEMLGRFDFGSIPSPDGQRKLFFRSHPHMFQPCTATDLWLDPGGGGKKKALVESMANF